MRMKPMPSQDMLDRLLTYDPESGKLYWKDRPASMFSDEFQPAWHNAKIWNSKNAGKETCVTALPNGHRYTSINRVKYLAHRLVWKLVYGEEPSGVIDHIDGDPTNNRIENLRDTTQTLNTRNARRSKNNTSGFNGVYYDKRRGQYIARLMVNRKNIWLGAFETAEEAGKKVREAGSLHGFHSNHGRSVAVLSTRTE